MRHQHHHHCLLKDNIQGKLLSIPRVTEFGEHRAAHNKALSTCSPVPRVASSPLCCGNFDKIVKILIPRPCVPTDASLSVTPQVQRSTEQRHIFVKLIVYVILIAEEFEFTFLASDGN